MSLSSVHLFISSKYLFIYRSIIYWSSYYSDWRIVLLLDLSLPAELFGLYKLTEWEGDFFFLVYFLLLLLVNILVAGYMVLKDCVLEKRKKSYLLFEFFIFNIIHVIIIICWLCIRMCFYLRRGFMMVYGTVFGLALLYIFSLHIFGAMMFKVA